MNSYNRIDLHGITLTVGYIEWEEDLRLYDSFIKSMQLVFK